ncbi:hypothetical protein ACFWP7_32170 [Streptomyces sp. NPDC058470]
MTRSGWAKARHRHGNGIRRWARAVESDGPPVAAHKGAEWDIVRGEY